MINLHLLDLLLIFKLPFFEKLGKFSDSIFVFILKLLTVVMFSH